MESYQSNISQTIIDTINTIFNKLFSSNTKIEEMRENTKKLAKLYSTRNICKIIMEQ